MRDVHASDQLQVLHGQVTRTGVARGAIVELARIGFGIGHKFFEVFGGDVGVNDEDIGHLGQQGDRHEVFVDVIGLVFEHVGVDR